MKQTGRTIPYRAKRRNELRASGHFRHLREDRKARWQALGPEPYTLVDRKAAFDKMVCDSRMQRVGRAAIKAKSNRRVII
jgi:hypothetical protein